MKEMGKTFFATMIVVVVAMFAGYNIYQSQSTMVLSDLALANVEALAMDENPDCPKGCMGRGFGCYCNGWYPYHKEYGS